MEVPQSNPGPRELAIETVGLTLTFGTFVAVDRITLQVPYREIFGLLGANGAGKTCTIKMLTTLLKPTAGSALVAGFDIVKSSAQVRGRIGYVPQMLSADGALTGHENLSLSARLYGLPREKSASRIDEALGFMGLRDAADRLVKTYSGGMVRRLELAQAMLHRPAVLFLDEPTIGLDPVARRAVWERLLHLKQEYGMTILITTHDMEEADYLCDEIAILHFGKVAVSGSPGVLRSSIGKGATLDDVFVHYAGGAIEETGSFRDIGQTRKTAQRLG
jgi:ABC-2 type transport system ATP-binding protein